MASTVEVITAPEKVDLELLQKFVASELPPEQSQMVDEWLRSSTLWQLGYTRILTEWFIARGSDALDERLELELTAPDEDDLRRDL
jgi:hypothetical protein